MDYKDFVWFVLSEEDKGNDISLDYWFKCIDLDDNGRLQKTEMHVSPSNRLVSVVKLILPPTGSPFYALQREEASGIGLAKMHSVIRCIGFPLIPSIRGNPMQEVDCWQCVVNPIVFRLLSFV